MKLAKLAGISLAGLVLASTVKADDLAGRPYWTIDAGLSLQHDIELKSIDTVPAYTGGADLELNPGARVDLMGGYNFTDNCAVELELGLLYNEIDKISGPTGTFSFAAAGADFDLYQFPVLVNGIYRFPVEWPVKPYVGIGAGAIVHVMKVRFAGDDDYERSVAFGYQGQAGISYEFAETAAVTLGYKFLGSTDTDFDGLETDGPMSHSFLVGFNFTF